MITFLWMLYLAFTILISIFTTYNLMINFVNECDPRNDNYSYSILASILWSIWYFYYLN